MGRHRFLASRSELRARVRHLEAEHHTLLHDLTRTLIRLAAAQEAAEEAAALRQEVTRLRTELTAARAQLANVTAVTVPPWRRDIDPSDQPTQPTDTRDLRERFEHGIPVRLGRSPLASTRPVPSWAARNGEDTQPLQAVDLSQEVA